MTTMRRTFKPEFKVQMVLEELTGLKSTAEICRKHRIRPQVFSRWKVEFWNAHRRYSPPNQVEVMNKNELASWSGWSDA